jgi:amino acid adenylation domain-containing protein/thioester reductase-like protein
MQNQTLEGFRLSPQQKHLWSLQQDSVAYRAQCAILLQGDLKREILKQTLEKIVDRHEILRTIFHRRSGLKTPIQVISDRSNLSWQTFNLSDRTPQQQQNTIEELFQKERNSIFDWEKDSLLRLSLITISLQQHMLLITLPSLCADSWALKILVKEISQTYSKCLSDRDLGDEPVQYLQFSEWQNELLEEEDTEAGKTYWKEQNLNSLTTVTLPFENQSKNKIFNPDCWSVKIDPAIATQLEYIADFHNTTIDQFLLTCWQILLWRITGQSEIAIETVFPGRTYKELHETIGLLAKWLPISCSVRGDFKFSEILSQIDRTLKNHNQWQEYFLWEEHTPFESKIAFEFEDWSNQYNSGGVSFSIDRPYVCFDRFKLKLTCIRQAESLTAEFHYDPEIVDLESIQYWGELFQTLVANALNNLEAKVSELEIISDRDRHLLLFEFNQTQTDYPLDKCIHQLFEEQAAKTPDRIAVVFENERLTYTELNTRANQLAHYLQTLGVKPEILVGIYLERSPLIIISILAILKAGGAYLPLDPALPTSGLVFRLQDAGVKVLLTQQQLIAEAKGKRFTLEWGQKATEEELATKIVYLDRDSLSIANESQENPHSQIKSENLVYVIYTSGSTGKPKGVAIEHKQLLNYFYSIHATVNLSEGNSFALVSTFAADLGNTVIFPSLCSGGCLHIISSERTADPEAVADYFDRHPIDCLKIVPSHLKALLATENPGKILPRQQLILGGETSSWDLIDRVREIVPECKILNHYGPTEATIGVTTFEVNKGVNSQNSATVPIGRAIANTQIYILDSEGKLVPIGVPGELHIGGAGLARGYLNQPKLTAQKFIINPFVGANGRSPLLYKTGDKARYLPDGNIEFLGRTDNQVKIRGFRIELGEIEAVLSQHLGVEQVVVSLSEDESGDRRLISYVVPKRQNTPSVSELRSFCLNKLPEYTIPSVFVLLKTLPLTSNGKIDRHALPVPDRIRPELEAVYLAPCNPIEEKLAEIWKQLLDLEQVGVRDNFFELGGHSLLITQLLAHIRTAFKVEISLQSLFKLPTIANIAKKIEQIQLTTSGDRIVKEKAIDLKAEAILDPTIHPNKLSYNPNVNPTAIFLTGATGFLGAFLLYELLDRTQADIYCLVRSIDIELGKQKLKNNLESYLLWNESFSNRIIPVIGDLSEPLLGISQQEFELMARQLDVIYHNGALVNFTYPYQTLKKPNVLGTQEVLRLASQVKLKPVHYISTTSFIYPIEQGTGNEERATGKILKEDLNLRTIAEENSIDDALIPNDGYAQSKWVAEKLVTIARDRGLPISIYRPGRISGHSKTGVCNSNDHTYRTIKGCIQLGSIPDLDFEWNLSPCDYVSKAIVYLSRQTESLGKAFHLRNPQPLRLSEMAQYIRAFGYPIELVSYDEWRSQLVDRADSSDNALYPLISTFTESIKINTDSDRSTAFPKQQYDCSNTNNGLANSAIACPPVDAKLFEIYLSYLKQTGVLQQFSDR